MSQTPSIKSTVKKTTAARREDADEFRERVFRKGSEQARRESWQDDDRAPFTALRGLNQHVCDGNNDRLVVALLENSLGNAFARKPGVQRQMRSLLVRRVASVRR